MLWATPTHVNYYPSQANSSGIQKKENLVKQKIVVCILLLVAIILISSCATLPQMNITIIPNKTIHSLQPTIGIENEVFIGETLIKEGTYPEQISIFLSSEYGKIRFNGYHHSGEYKCIGTADEYKLYQGTIINDTGLSRTYSQIVENNEGICYRKLDYGLKLLPKSEYTKKKYADKSSDNFEQNLVYTGREGNILKFSYREFYNDMARASYTMDVTYDLSKDNIIRFKSASLEIIKADNQSITYKLLSGFKSKS